MHIEKRTLRNIFLGVLGCIVLYWVLHETERVKSVFKFISGILFPFVFGAAVAFILNVPMRGIERILKKLKKASIRRALAILITIMCVLLVLAIVFWLLIPQVVDTVQSLIPKLNTFFNHSQSWLSNFLSENPKMLEWLKGSGFEELNIADMAQKLISVFGSSVSSILGSTWSAIGSISGTMVDVVIGLVFAIYCLFQKETLARQGRKLLYAFVPEKIADGIIRILRLTNVTFSNFLSGQCLEVVILGCLFAISMAIFQMPYIPLVSVLVAVTAFIPVVGAWVGCILGTFFILVANPLQALWFVIMFVVLQQIENNLIYPRVVGTSIGLSGMWVLVAIAVGGELMGVAGMFLMIPIASVLQTLLRELVNKRLQMRNVEAEKLIPQPPNANRLKLRNDNKKKKK